MILMVYRLLLNVPLNRNINENMLVIADIAERIHLRIFFETDIALAVTVHSAQCTVHSAQGTGHRAQGTVHRAQGTGHRAQGTGHRAQGTGHRAQGTGHRAQGVWQRVLRQ